MSAGIRGITGHGVFVFDAGDGIEFYEAECVEEGLPAAGDGPDCTTPLSLHPSFSFLSPTSRREETADEGIGRADRCLVD